jgi:hypothetical protein
MDAISPNHQTSQVSANWPASTIPPRRRFDTPIVALTPLPSAPAKISAKALRTSPRRRSNLKRRRSRNATSASSVFPAAIPAATASGAEPMRLLRRAPT